MFRELTAFLLCLKKRTRDYVGVVRVRHDFHSLSLFLESWKVLLRCFSAAHKSEVDSENSRGGSDAWAGGGRRAAALSRFRWPLHTEGKQLRNDQPARPLWSSSPDNTSPIIPSPPAFMDEPQTLFLLHCVGQTGNGERHFNPFLSSVRHWAPAGQMKTAAEVADGLSYLFFHIALRMEA